MLRLPVAAASAPCVSSPLVTNGPTVSVPVPDRLFRLLFIVALLVSQFSLLHHQLDIEHHANGKACTICLASPGLDHALGGTFLPPLDQAAFEVPAILRPSFCGSRIPVRLVARSPPLSLLHA